MSFRRQVRWALTRGLAAVALGAGFGPVAVALQRVSLPGAGLAAGLSMGLILCGAMLFLWGGLVRPLQRRVFLGGMPSGRLRRLVLDRPALRWWYGVTTDGQARDDG